MTSLLFIWNKLVVVAGFLTDAYSHNKSTMVCCMQVLHRVAEH